MQETKSSAEEANKRWLEREKKDADPHFFSVRQDRANVKGKTNGVQKQQSIDVVVPQYFFLQCVTSETTLAFFEKRPYFLIVPLKVVVVFVRKPLFETKQNLFA